MEHKFARTCSYAVLILALAIGVVAVATSNNLVSAQACTAQLGSPTTTNQQYYGSNLQVTVPVSTSCSYYTPQLYATGTAYDTTYSTNIGTANTVLSVAYGGYGSSGQLQFNLPASAVSHPVLFSVSIYGTQPGYYQQYYGSVITTASETFVIGPSYLNSYQNYPYNPTYPTYPTYPNPYPTYPTYPTYRSYPTYPRYPYFPGNYQYHPYPYQNQNPGNYYYNYGGNYNNRYCTRSNNYCNNYRYPPK